MYEIVCFNHFFSPIIVQWRAPAVGNSKQVTISNTITVVFLPQLREVTGRLCVQLLWHQYQCTFCQSESSILSSLVFTLFHFFFTDSLCHCRLGSFFMWSELKEDPWQVTNSGPPHPQPPAVSIPDFSNMALNVSLAWPSLTCNPKALYTDAYQIAASAWVLPDQVLLFWTIALLV